MFSQHSQPPRSSHTSYNHFLQPQQQQQLSPPRTTTGSFRNSLRLRKPSTIFTKSENSKDKKNSNSSSSSSSKQVEGARMEVKSPEKKPKTRTRKALGELFGWGNSSSSSSSTAAPIVPPRQSSKPAVVLPVQAPIQSAAPPPTSFKPVPAATQITSIGKAPTPPAKEPMLLRKHASQQRLSNKSSNSALSVFSAKTVALKPPVEPIQLGRASMGDDPFCKDEDGAEVVEHLSRRGVTTPGSRVSMTSTTKAPSTRSVNTVSHKRRESGNSEVEALIKPIVKPLTFTRKPVPPIPVDVPMANSTDLVNPPPRSASLKPGVRSNTPAPAVATVHLPTPKEAQPIKHTSAAAISPRLRKTRSRVWDFLHGKKSVKAKNIEIKSMAPLTNITNTMNPNDNNNDNNVDDDEESYVKINLAPSTKTSTSNSSRPTSSNLSNISTSAAVAAPTRQPIQQAPGGTLNRPRPPIVHVQQPSVDFSMPPVTASAAWVSRPFDNIFAQPPAQPPIQPASQIHRQGTTEGGVWESVVGSFNPPRQVTSQVVTSLPKALPKRKSLTGLFIRRSIERFREKSPKKAGENNTLRMRSLAEEMGPEAAFSEHTHDHSQEYVNENMARRASPGLRNVASATDRLVNLVSNFALTPGTPSDTRASPALSADQSLQSIEAGFNGSPTPMRTTRSAMLSHKPSVGAINAPTVSPLKLALHRAQVVSSRRVRQNPKLEQLKAQEAQSNPHATPDAATGSSPQKRSLVKKGMRNVFAPPSPINAKGVRPQVSASSLRAPRTAMDIDDRKTFVSRYETYAAASSSAVTQAREVDIRTRVQSDASSTTGLPGDLKAFMLDRRILEAEPASLDVTTHLGLPPPPIYNRPTPRRPPKAVPDVALPPLPSPIHHTQQYQEQRNDRISPMPPQISLEWARDDAPRDSVFSDLLTPTGEFDFTGEYANLDRGDQRASFIEAVHAITAGATREEDIPPVPPMPAFLSAPVSYPTRPSPVREYSEEMEDSESGEDEDSDEEDDEEEEDEEEEEDDEAEVKICRAQITPRREPFRGQIAFQQHASMRPPLPTETGFAGRIIHAPVRASAPPAPIADLPKPNGYAHGRRGHRRGESGLSIATMSSIGAVIETGIAGEYTNYFEVNFSKHLGQQISSSSGIGKDDKRSSVDEVSLGLDGASTRGNTSRQGSVSSVSDLLGSDGRRAPTRRANHHRRNSSIVSIESNLAAELNASTSSNGPPISLHNPRRSSYFSRHRRDGSVESAWGRADWAKHKRGGGGSSDSNNSIGSSISRLARPGLGERMFQLDGGVQLTSITASPVGVPQDTKSKPRLSKLSEGSEGNHTQSHKMDLMEDISRDDRPASSTTCFTDGFASSRPDSLCDSLFGASHARSESKDFFLKGARPISSVSTASTLASLPADMDDTFSNVQKYLAKQEAERQREEEACLQGQGEVEETVSSLGSSHGSGGGRQLLNTSINRPRKPSANRRRPANLVFNGDVDGTPGLTSPSASETSSRLSLDTRFSGFSDMVSNGRARPAGMGHARQKSSAVVNLQSTIREEPSYATLRPTGTRSPTANTTVVVPRKPSRQTLREPTIVGWNEETSNTDAVTSWLRYQREAEAVCKISKTSYHASEETNEQVSEWKIPTTQAEIAAFLAKSTAAFKPLDPNSFKHPTTKPNVQRRQSSLAMSRSLVSPYGLPLPPRPTEVQMKPKRGSLETKFERSNSATSSNFSFAYSGGEDGTTRRVIGGSSPPRSSPLANSGATASIFAKFAIPHLPSPPPAKTTFANVAPVNLSSHIKQPVKATAKEAITKTTQATLMVPLEEQRPRVNSNARRQALGWGRRRNSDGPAKVVEAGKKGVPAVPKTATGATFASQGYNTARLVAHTDKENSGGVNGRQQVKPQRSSRKILGARPNNQLRGLRA